MIIGESRSWNENLIRNSFSRMEAEAMLEIRLSRRSIADRLIWVSDKLGHFTVRSAYSMAIVVLGKKELRMKNRSPLWKILWAAKTRPKVKCFI